MYDVRAADELVHEMVSAICATESFNDTRPWLQLTESGVMELHAEQDRGQLLTDPRGRAMYLSCGAALFGLRVAARALGYRPLIRLQCGEPVQSTLIATVELAPGSPATHLEHDMLAALEHRLEGSAPLRRRGLPDSIAVSLEQAAGFECASLRMLDVGEARLAVLTTVRDGRADWLRAGQALERIVLTAARYGLMTSLHYQPIELRDLQDEPGWWPWPEQPQVIIRFGAEPRTEVPQAEAARPCALPAPPGDAQPS